MEQEQPMSQTNTIYLITKNEKRFRDLGWEQFISLEDALTILSALDWIAVDTETTALSFVEGHIHTIQIGDSHMQFVFDMETIEYKALKPLLETKNLIFQNASFDLTFLYEVGIVPRGKIYDTLVAEICLSLGVLQYKRSLDALVMRYLGIELDKGYQEHINKGLDSVEAILYSGMDVRYLHEIKAAQEVVVERRGHKLQVEIECAYTRVIAYLEWCGIYLDKDKWHRLVRRNDSNELIAEDKLYEYIKANHPDLYQEEFNWNSNKEVVQLLQKLGIDTWDAREKKHKADIKLLVKQKHPFIPLYVDYRQKNKIVTTYGANWYAYISEKTDRIHTKFNILVATGRTSCGQKKNGNFPNLQNIPRGSQMRASFRGQRGNVLVMSDYSAQESVVMADRSEEPNLIEFYQKGEGDLHSYVARLVFKDELSGLTLDEIKELHPDKRQRAKGAGFAINYGGNGYTIANNLNIPLEEGEYVYDNYMKAFSKLSQYFQDTYEQTLRQGYILIDPVTGAKRYISGFKELRRDMRNPMYRPLLSKIYKESLNTPIQGTSSLMSKVAGNDIFDWIVENRGYFGKVKMVNFVHDEYVMECHPARAEEVAEKVQFFMERAGQMFLKTLSIKAEPKISKYWQK